MRKLILLFVVLAIIGLGWFIYFSGEDQTQNVTIVTAENMDLENTLEFSGEVVPEHMYSVMSPTGGIVEKIFVSEGSKVFLGDQLIKLNTAELEAQLAEAKLNYQVLTETTTQTVMTQQSAAIQNAASEMANQKAKVALALSQTTGFDFASFNEAFGVTIDENAAAMAASLGDMTIDDINNLSNLGNNTDKTMSEVMSAGEIALAEMAVKRLEGTIEQMSINSLMKGTVIAVNLHKGEVLAPGVPAMVIADTQNTLINAYVYEKDVGELTTGMEVRIHTDHGFYKGTLTKIGKAASGIGVTSTLDTMIKVEITPSKSFSRMPGAVVDLEIVLSEKKDKLALPMDCITEDNCVFVVNEEENLEKRKVVTGFRDMFNTEILSGLVAGEMVVLSPKNLKEGQHVAYDRSE